METGKVTDQDKINMYTTCKEPGCKYLILLEAGTEVKFTTCSQCGSRYAVKKNDFKGVDKDV